MTPSTAIDVGLETTKSTTNHNPAYSESFDALRVNDSSPSDAVRVENSGVSIASNASGDGRGAVSDGSIPAWAGEPHRRHYESANTAVYPRVGGGTYLATFLNALPEGLSPRGRGNRRNLNPGKDHLGSIPAWAGEPLSLPPPARDGGVYPRVGGGTLPQVDALTRGLGLSPRGRGNRQPLHHRPGRRRSIPAWAGEPRPASAAYASQSVYPRVGGGTQPWIRLLYTPKGLSPRGRGNRA